MGETKPFERLSETVIAEINKRWRGAERGPYLIVTDPNKLGDNWFVANLGCGADGEEVYLTTDHVHASECVSTAESQAEFFAHAESDMRILWRSLGAAYQEIDRLTGQRLWQRWWGPRRRTVQRLVNRYREWRRWHQLNPFGQDGAVRWWIANLLHRRRDSCWSALVAWAMTDDFWAWTNFLPSSRWYQGANSCRMEARKDGSCYCGKFATQKHVDELRAEGATGHNPIIVTDTVEPEDAPDLTTFTFKGSDGR